MKNETTEFCSIRIYEEGGFRVMETRKAGRAVFEAD